MEYNTILINFFIEHQLINPLKEEEIEKLLKKYPNENYPSNIYEKNGNLYNIDDFFKLSKEQIEMIIESQKTTYEKNISHSVSSNNDLINQKSKDINDTNSQRNSYLAETSKSLNKISRLFQNVLIALLALVTIEAILFIMQII